MVEPTHGYDLHQRVEEELGRVWRVGLSNLYAALKRLEESGAVEYTLSPQEDRPDRKIYQITPPGRERFLAWVREPIPSMRDMRVIFPAKLYFFHRLDLKGVKALIAAQEDACRQRLDRLNASAARHPSDDFNQLVFDFRRRQLEAILDWLQACADTTYLNASMRERK
jgi:DNA-binding PadR family transcriptional regulator